MVGPPYDLDATLPTDWMLGHWSLSLPAVRSVRRRLSVTCPMLRDGPPPNTGHILAISDIGRSPAARLLSFDGRGSFGPVNAMTKATERTDAVSPNNISLFVS